MPGNSGRETQKHSINGMREAEGSILQYGKPRLVKVCNEAMQCKTNAERPWCAQHATAVSAGLQVQCIDCLAHTGYVFCGTLVSVFVYSPHPCMPQFFVVPMGKHI